MHEAIATLRSTMALTKDERAPPSLGSQLNFIGFRLAELSARTGQSRTAEQDLRAAMRAHAQFIALAPEESMFRVLQPYSEDAWRARLNSLTGEEASALHEATRIARRVKHIEAPPDSPTAAIVRSNYLRNLLATAGVAAIRTGRYAEAEAASRERFELPPDRFSDADPDLERSRTRAMLAHAIAKQDRPAEARDALLPALEYYRREQKAGAIGLTFRRDFAYALFVSTLVETGDPTGGAGKDQALDTKRPE